MNQDDPEAPISNRGCLLLVAVWFLWAGAMFARVCYLSMTVDGTDIPTAVLLALIFGFATFEGIALYHFPGILYFGGMIGLTVVKSKYPDVPRPVVWGAVGLGALAVVSFYILSMIMDDGCNPLQQIGCI